MSLQKRIRKNMERTAATEKAAKAAAKRQERKMAELKQQVKQVGAASLRNRTIRATALLAALASREDR